MAQTIVAAATPLVEGSIGVIRLSGDNAIEIAQQCFRCKNGNSLCKMKGYTAAYGSFFDKDREIDDGVALVFKEPHSYTGENVVEISLHGGPVVIKQAIRSLIENGAVQAIGGEFTKRAFLNGKMSLSQAEAVMDVIGAQSSSALAAANAVKNGSVYKKIEQIKAKIVYCAATLSAYIDFPEEGEQMMDESGFLSGLSDAKTELELLIKSYDSGRIIKNGIDCVIAGKPNVGKSTLMNCLAGETRSIVTPIAGTTRDVIRETIDIGGIVLNLSDTAGLHGGGDEVEKIGIDIARQALVNAQLVLCVFDSAKPLDKEDFQLLKSVCDKPKIIVLNKSDVGGVLFAEDFAQYGETVEISAKSGNGVEQLKKAVIKTAGLSSVNQSDAVLSNERQLGCVKKAADSVFAAKTDFESGQTPDAVSVLLYDAVSALNELSGENASETVVNEVFSKFCVGK